MSHSPARCADPLKPPTTCVSGASRNERGSRGERAGRRTHQVEEVVAVEATTNVVARVAERRLEPLEGTATTLDVRGVRAEHAHVRAALLDDPAGVLRRVWREADLPLHELRRPQRQRTQPLLVTPERLERGFHL